VQCTVEYVNTTAKIGTLGSAGILERASMSATATMLTIVRTKATAETLTTNRTTQ